MHPGLDTQANKIFEKSLGEEAKDVAEKCFGKRNWETVGVDVAPKGCKPCKFCKTTDQICVEMPKKGDWHGNGLVMRICCLCDDAVEEYIHRTSFSVLDVVVRQWNKMNDELGEGDTVKLIAELFIGNSTWLQTENQGRLVKFQDNGFSGHEEAHVEFDFGGWKVKTLVSLSKLEKVEKVII